MRGIVGAVCHGPKRRPLEPHGVVAPTVRLVAWVTLFVSAVVGVATVVAVWVEAPAVIETLVVFTGAGLFVGVTLLGYAHLLRPRPLDLPAPAQEPRS